MNKMSKKLLLLYGFIAPMPILTFMGVTWFGWATMLFGIAILCRIIGKKKILLKWNFYCVILVTVIISSLICLMTDLPAYWKVEQYKNIVWEVMYFSIFMWFLISKEDDASVFLKGIYYSSIFQMFWGFLQFVFYNVMQIKINNIIFGDLLKMQTRELTQLKGNSIALSGMCWNAGNLAALMCFGYFFCDSTFLKVMFIAFSLLSGSRTLLLGMCICVIGDLYIHKNEKISLNRNTIIWALSIVTVMVVIIFNNRLILTHLIEKINYLIEAFSRENLSSQTSSKIHLRYWLTIGQVAKWNGTIHNLFGWGNGCSGYPFSAIFGQFVGEQWVVECDYINRLWSFGFVGFFLWYGWFIKMMLNGLKIDKKYFFLLFAILIEGITYNVIQMWSYLTLLIFFSDVMKEKNVFNIMQNTNKTVNRSISSKTDQL